LSITIRNTAEKIKGLKFEDPETLRAGQEI